MTSFGPKRPGAKMFDQRLKACMRSGNLTVADLARWFDRSHATMRTWVAGAHPSGAPLDVEHAREMLKLLELLIKRRLGFPVPRLSPRERLAHLSGVREKVLASSPQ